MPLKEMMQPWELRRDDFVDTFPQTVASYLQLFSVLHNNQARLAAADLSTVKQTRARTLMQEKRNMIKASLYSHPSNGGSIARETLRTISLNPSLYTTHDLQAMRIQLFDDLGEIHTELSMRAMNTPSDAGETRMQVEKLFSIHYYMHADIEFHAMTGRHAYPIVTAFNVLGQTRIGTAITQLYRQLPGSRIQFGTLDAARSLTSTITLPAPGLFNF